MRAKESRCRAEKENERDYRVAPRKLWAMISRRQRRLTDKLRIPYIYIYIYSTLYIIYTIEYDDGGLSSQPHQYLYRLLAWRGSNGCKI